MRTLILVMLLAAAPATAQQSDVPTLDTLLAAPKFEATPLYSGVDSPEDKPALAAIINQAIRDIQQLPQPRDPARVRKRLTAVIDNVETFATADRQAAYRYCIQIWRAAGPTEPSQLFEASDFEVMLMP